MFDKKPIKFSEGEQIFLDSLYNLILDKSVKAEERAILIDAKNEFERTGDFARIVGNLIGNFRLQAINRTLSQPLSQFYSKLYSTSSGLANLEKGAGISALLLPIWTGNGGA